MIKTLVVIVVGLVFVLGSRADDLPEHFISYDEMGGMMRARGLTYGYAYYSHLAEDGKKFYLTLNTGLGLPYRSEVVDSYTPRVPVFARLIWGDLFNLELEAGAVWGGVNRRLPEEEQPDYPKYQTIDMPVGLGVSFQYEVMYLRFGVGYVVSSNSTAYLSSGIGFAL